MTQKFNLDFKNSIKSINLKTIIESTKKPLILNGALNRFTTVLSGLDFINYADQLKYSQALDSPFLYVSTNGKRIQKTAYLFQKKHIWHDNPDKGVHKTLSEKFGLTLRLTDFHKLSNELDNLRKIIFEETSSSYGEAHTFYTTPNSGVAVPAHRDCGVQVIFQILGEKTWYFGKDEDETLVTKAGDLLIIPFAYWHRTQTYDNYSVHIAFMLDPLPEFVVMDLLTSVWKLGASHPL